MKFLQGQGFASLPFVVVDLQGRIVRTGTAPANMIEIQAQPEEQVFAGVADPPLQYIDAEAATVLARPSMTPAIDGVTISNLPQSCEVTVEGQTLTVTSGSIEFDFELPGTYDVLLKAFPYLDLVVQVTQP